MIIPIRKPEPTWIDGAECYYIPLDKNLFAIIDKEDLRFVENRNWYASQEGSEYNPIWYARRSSTKEERQHGKSKSLRMHIEIMGFSGIDHFNGIGLDNRRSNLRPSNQSQNLANARMMSNNTSGFRGVSKQDGYWHAQVQTKTRKISLGFFKTPQEAAEAYNVAAFECWGKFARLNTIPSQPLSGQT